MTVVCYWHPYHQSDIDNPSLVISVTAIAESAMYFVSNAMLALKLYTTICGVRNLCIMKCVSLLDLLLDES